MSKKKKTSKKSTSKTTLICRVGFFIALTAGLVALISGPGTSFGLWNYQTGLSMLRWAAYGSILAAALSLVGLIASLRIVIVRGFVWALLGIVIGSSVAGLMFHWKQVSESVPRIHDITTDTQDPPQFVSILRLLNCDENSHVYEGAKVAALQQKAYPDIIPVTLHLPQDQAFEKALATARKLGWSIIDADENAGRIEALEISFWFGFKDDIVIRVRQQNSGSRVDIRSVSRVGKSDLGKNAERIRRFLQAIKE